MAYPAGAAAAHPGGAGAPPRRVLAVWLSGGVAARAPGLERVVFPVRIPEREPVVGDPAVELVAMAGPAGRDPGTPGVGGAWVYLAAEDSLERARPGLALLFEANCRAGPQAGSPSRRALPPVASASGGLRLR